MHLYRHFNLEGELLYVGISLSALNRLAKHKSSSHWFNEITNVTIQKFSTKEEAVAAEIEAIAKENPRHNIKRPQPYEKPLSQLSVLELLQRILVEVKKRGDRLEQEI